MGWWLVCFCAGGTGPEQCCLVMQVAWGQSTAFAQIWVVLTVLAACTMQAEACKLQHRVLNPSPDQAIAQTLHTARGLTLHVHLKML